VLEPSPSGWRRRAVFRALRGCRLQHVPNEAARFKSKQVADRSSA